VGLSSDCDGELVNKPCEPFFPRQKRSASQIKTPFDLAPENCTAYNVSSSDLRGDRIERYTA
jgi:hypothetical protein